MLVGAVVAALGAAAAGAATRPSAPTPCAEAQALEALNRLSSAEAVYLRELGNPASLACATAGLNRLRRFDQSCTYANALAHDGEQQAAHAAYVQILSIDSSSQCAAAGLKATAAHSTTSVWTTVGNVVTDAGLVIGTVLLALLLIGVVILLGLQIQTRVPRMRDVWPANKIRRPVFVVDALSDDGTDKYGSSVAGLIRGRVTWKTDRFGLNLVSGQAGVAQAFSGLGDVSPEAKAAVAVITFLTALLPRRRFGLTGQLQPAGAEGVGLSLELSQNGDAEALISMWAASFDVSGADAASAYQHLAIAGAAWVDIWMAKALGGQALLTADPQSWAFFRSGMDAQRLGDTDRAKIMYEQALAADGTNVGAMANLGIMSRRAGRYEDAEEYLQRALPATENTDLAPHLHQHENPDWYRIKYQFAALYTTWAMVSEPGAQRDKRAQDAATEAKDLAIIALDKIANLVSAGDGQGGARTGYLQGTLRPFLEGTIEPSVLALVAGTASPIPSRPDGWSQGARPSVDQVRATLTSQTIDPWRLIAFVEKGPSRPPATLYNLACFYTRYHDYTTASKRLLHAVRETQRQERPSLVKVALGDPVLAPLLAKRPGITAKLYEMLDDAPPVEDADLMREYFDRQDHAVSHFESIGWTLTWKVDAPGFDVLGAKESALSFIRVVGAQASAEDTVASIVGQITMFRDAHPDAADVRASLVISTESDVEPADLDIARAQQIEILRDTKRGLECLTEAQPAQV